MRNRIDIDYSHSRAIVQEIGERLRASLEIDRELPASLRMQIDRLRQSEGPSQQTLLGRRRVGGHAAHGREARRSRVGLTAMASSFSEGERVRLFTLSLPESLPESFQFFSVGACSHWLVLLDGSTGGRFCLRAFMVSDV